MAKKVAQNKEKPKAKEPQKRRAPVLMPGGKYMNVPVNQVDDLWIILFYLSPRMAAPKPARKASKGKSSRKAYAGHSPELMEALHKRAGNLLKANGWKMPPQ